jgi:ABC-type nitrate/sulfonate/bicarbonate transport system permease component
MAQALAGAAGALHLGVAEESKRPGAIAGRTEPLVAALHPLPKVAIFPIVLVLLGIGEASKVALVALTAFFPMVINTLAGVRQIDNAYWEAAANYGARGRALLWRVILPGSLLMVLVGRVWR